VLILNRRQGEAIIIDGGIRIVVLSSDRRGARIGIEAPTSVNIQREELITKLATRLPPNPAAE
jgi:carbon storage regulator